MPPKKKPAVVNWCLTATKENHKIELHPGIQVLGRHDLPNKDTRVSRKHVQITVDGSVRLDGKLYSTYIRLSRVGHNPMRVLRFEVPIDLDIGDPLCLLS